MGSRFLNIRKAPWREWRVILKPDGTLSSTSGAKLKIGVIDPNDTNHIIAKLDPSEPVPLDTWVRVRVQGPNNCYFKTNMFLSKVSDKVTNVIRWPSKFSFVKMYFKGRIFYLWYTVKYYSYIRWLPEEKW